MSAKAALEEAVSELESSPEAELDASALEALCADLRRNPAQLAREDAAAVRDLLLRAEALLRQRAAEMSEELHRIRDGRRGLRGYGGLRSASVSQRLHRKA